MASSFAPMPSIFSPNPTLGISKQVTPATPEQVAEADLASRATTTPTAINALDLLLKQLITGGTPEMQATTQARQQEISNARGQQNKYSKEAAIADAQGLIQKAIADALRIAAPKITAYAEGAGTSKSSLAALQTQEAATRGAVEGAAQAGQMSTAYGQVYNQLAGILESLTRQDPNSVSALLAQTISGSRGLIQPPDLRAYPVNQGNSNKSATTVPQQNIQTPNSVNPYIDSGYLPAPSVVNEQVGTRQPTLIIGRNVEDSLAAQTFDSNQIADEYAGIFDSGSSYSSAFEEQ